MARYNYYIVHYNKVILEEWYMEESRKAAGAEATPYFKMTT